MTSAGVTSDPSTAACALANMVTSLLRAIASASTEGVPLPVTAIARSSSGNRREYEKKSVATKASTVVAVVTASSRPGADENMSDLHGRASGRGVQVKRACATRFAGGTVIKGAS